jgi:hypothetical protein
LTYQDFEGCPGLQGIFILYNPVSSLNREARAVLETETNLRDFYFKGADWIRVILNVGEE